MNIFVFMNILLICVVVPFWWVLRTVNDNSSSVVVLYLGYGGTAALCQLLLFVPKVFPPLMRHMFHKTMREKLRNRSFLSSETTFSQSTQTS